MTSSKSKARCAPRLKSRGLGERSCFGCSRNNRHPEGRGFLSSSLTLRNIKNSSLKSQKINLLSIVRDACKAYGRNPQILIPALMLILAMFLMHELSGLILPYLQTTASNVIWSLIATLLQLAILAYCFSAILALSANIIQEDKKSFSQIFTIAWKRMLTMFILLLFALIIFMLLNALALTAGKSALAFNSSAALASVLAIWIIGFFGCIIFLAFANVLCVTENLNAFASVRASAHIVMNNYLVVSFLSIVFFIILYFIERFISEFLAELIKSLVLLPYLALFLVYFIRQVQKNGLHTS